MPSIYNKDKPWDTEDIDKWKIEQFKPEDNVGGHFVEESSFATLFPKVGSSTPAQAPMRALSATQITHASELFDLTFHG